MLKIAKKIYRSLFSQKVRASSTVTWLKWLCYRSFFKHAWIYDKDYYENYVEGPALLSSTGISESIMTNFHPETVIDVGCGTGALLYALQTKGCKVYGLERSAAALEYCRSRHLDVRQFEIGKDTLSLCGQYDLVVSLEVAEHLPERVADKYVDLLSGLSNTIVFTAAPPGQMGTDHVNLQPKEYWVEEFGKRGLIYDAATTEKLKKEWQRNGKIVGWYYQNLMIFRRP